MRRSWERLARSSNSAVGVVRHLVELPAREICGARGGGAPVDLKVPAEKKGFTHNIETACPPPMTICTRQDTWACIFVFLFLAVRPQVWVLLAFQLPTTPYHVAMTCVRARHPALPPRSAQWLSSNDNLPASPSTRGVLPCVDYQSGFEHAQLSCASSANCCSGSRAQPAAASSAPLSQQLSPSSFWTKTPPCPGDLVRIQTIASGQTWRLAPCAQTPPEDKKVSTTGDSHPT